MRVCRWAVLFGLGRAGSISDHVFLVYGVLVFAGRVSEAGGMLMCVWFVAESAASVGCWERGGISQTNTERVKRKEERWKGSFPWACFD